MLVNRKSKQSGPTIYPISTERTTPLN